MVNFCKNRHYFPDMLDIVLNIRLVSAWKQSGYIMKSI
jgi:hypothetical protein